MVLAHQHAVGGFHLVVAGINDGSTTACVGSFNSNSSSCGSGAATEAIVGSTAHLGSFVGGSPSISGQVNVISNGDNAANAVMSAASGGLAAVNVVSPKAYSYGQTTARIDGSVGDFHTAPDGREVGDSGAAFVGTS